MEVFCDFDIDGITLERYVQILTISNRLYRCLQNFRFELGYFLFKGLHSLKQLNARLVGRVTLVLQIYDVFRGCQDIILQVSLFLDILLRFCFQNFDLFLKRIIQNSSLLACTFKLISVADLIFSGLFELDAQGVKFLCFLICPLKQLLKLFVVGQDIFDDSFLSFNLCDYNAKMLKFDSVLIKAHLRFKILSTFIFSKFDSLRLCIELWAR